MKIDLTGKVVLVTGAAKNIGATIANRFAEAGATVVCGYRVNASDAAATCGKLEQMGITAQTCEIDATDVASISNTVAEIDRSLGGIDILVNNAAIRPRTRIAEVSATEWDSVMATNLRGPFFLSQAVIPGMRAKQWGRIINIGGIDAYWGNPQRPHVVSSKAGLIGLTRALANETARWGITVNIVVPGGFNTERPVPEWYPDLEKLAQARHNRVPMGRLGEPDELAGAVVFLASEQASYITGQELVVSGGAFPAVRQPENEYE